MQKIDQVLHARWVLPIAPQNIILEHHAVAIHQGKIFDCLPSEAAKQRYQPARTSHLTDHVLMPGFVNAHTHSPMNLFRGMADDLDLMDWLNHHIWPAEAELIHPDSIEIGSLLAIAEMIRGGTTCFNDHYMFPQHTAIAAKSSGIRASLGLQIMDPPTQWAKNGDEAFNRSMDVLESTPQDDRLHWQFAPHAPYTVSDETFSRIREANETLALPIHIHCHETTHEVKESIKLHGMRPLERMNALGLLSSRFVAVHMTACSESDIELARTNDIQIVHCPESNLKLASGFAPIQAFLDAGINVAIGTDGAASNNDLDMLGEIRTAALLAKAQSQDPRSLDAQTAIHLATMGGAKALGLDDVIGSIEPDKSADLIAIDLSNPMSQPCFNPFSHIVYATNSRDITHTWVQGKALLEDKKLISIDIHKLLTDAEPLFEAVKKHQQKAK